MAYETCRICKGTDILRYPGSVGGHGGGTNLRYGRLMDEAVPVTQFLCGTCGHIEHCIDDKQALEFLKRKLREPPKEGLIRRFLGSLGEPATRA